VLNLSCGLLCALAVLGSASSEAGLLPADVQALPHDQVERMLPASHPSSYYGYAARLFHEGTKEDAVFWFYVGEIRYRFHLAVNPKLAPDGDPALFSSLHETVGSAINGWAGSDPDSWEAQLQRALDWDARNDNGFTSKAAHRKEWWETRGGLEKLKIWVSTHKSEILEDRRKHGL